MELKQLNSISETTRLVCDKHDPPCESFRLEFKKSAAANEYSKHCRATGRPTHPPDTMIAVCTQCGNEIVVEDHHDHDGIINEGYDFEKTEGFYIRDDYGKVRYKPPDPDWYEQRIRREQQEKARLADSMRQASESLKDFFNKEGWPH
jgi:hypothetical protein